MSAYCANYRSGHTLLIHLLVFNHIIVHTSCELIQNLAPAKAVFLVVEPFKAIMTWLVGTVSVGSLIVVSLSIFAIGRMVSDLSSLQTEVNEGMVNIRVSAVPQRFEIRQKCTLHSSVSFSSLFFFSLDFLIYFADTKFHEIKNPARLSLLLFFMFSWTEEAPKILRKSMNYF